MRNAELMQRLSLVPKLLFVLQDDSVTDATAHTIASVLSVLLSNTNDKKNLLRYEIFQLHPTSLWCNITKCFLKPGLGLKLMRIL